MIKLRIAEMRRYKGLSQEQLAKRSDVELTILVKIESGEIDPHLEILRKLAQGLGIATIDLLPIEDWIRPRGKFAARPQPVFLNPSIK
jgi:transcriptional regulator with XRE-family HTH domain